MPVSSQSHQRTARFVQITYLLVRSGDLSRAGQGWNDF